MTTIPRQEVASATAMELRRRARTGAAAPAPPGDTTATTTTIALEARAWIGKRERESVEAGATEEGTREFFFSTWAMDDRLFRRCAPSQPRPSSYVTLSSPRSVSPSRKRTPRRAYPFDNGHEDDSIEEDSPAVSNNNNNNVTFGDAHHLSSSLFFAGIGGGGGGGNPAATPSDGIPTPSEWRGGISLGGNHNDSGGPSPRRTGGGGKSAAPSCRRSSLGGGGGEGVALYQDSETGGLSAREALLSPPPRGGSPIDDGGGGPASVSASDAGGGAGVGSAAARRRLSAASAASAAAAAAAARHAEASASPSIPAATAAAPPRRTTNGSSQTEYDLRMQQLYRQQQQRLLRGQQQQSQSQRQQAAVPPSLATGAAAGVAPSSLVLMGSGAGSIGGIPQPPPSHAVTSADDMAKEGALIEAAVGGGGGGGGKETSSNNASAAAAAGDGGGAPPSSSNPEGDSNPANSAAAQAAYCRVITPEPAPSEEAEDVCALLRECLELRAKWLFSPATPPERRPAAPEAAAPSEVAGRPPPFEWGESEPGPAPYVAEMVGGVMHVYEIDGSAAAAQRGAGNEAEPSSPSPAPLLPGAPPPPPPATTTTTEPQQLQRRQQQQRPRKGRRVFSPPGDANAFFADLHRVLKIAALGPVKSFAHHRLVLLEQKFNLHVMLNADKEFLAQKSAPHRDFYNVRKVDTHVHHSACMHQKHLLRFMKSKLRKEPDEVVIFRDGKYLTLAEVFESLRLTAHSLNVDALDMHADKGTFHRFDRFNLKYNPFGQARLREVFIKQDNLIRGRFLAELTKEVFVDLEASKYQQAEYRVSIYGRKRVEWDTLAAWVLNNGLYSVNG